MKYCYFPRILMRKYILTALETLSNLICSYKKTWRLESKRFRGI